MHFDTSRTATSIAAARISAVIPELDHDTTLDRIERTPGTTAAKLYALTSTLGGLDFETAAARIRAEADTAIPIRHVALELEAEAETDELYLNALIHMPDRTVLYAHLQLETVDERGYQDSLSVEMPVDHPLARLAAASATYATSA